MKHADVSEVPGVIYSRWVVVWRWAHTISTSVLSAHHFTGTSTSHVDAYASCAYTYRLQNAPISVSPLLGGTQWACDKSLCSCFVLPGSTTPVSVVCSRRMTYDRVRSFHVLVFPFRSDPHRASTTLYRSGFEFANDVCADSGADSNEYQGSLYTPFPSW